MPIETNQKKVNSENYPGPSLVMKLSEQITLKRHTATSKPGHTDAGLAHKFDLHSLYGICDKSILESWDLLSGCEDDPKLRLYASR